MSSSQTTRTDPIHIIQNPRRRLFIKVLVKLGGEASLRELVRRIAKMMGDPDDKKLVKNIYISMIQTHIPKMERAGLIRYDRANGTVYLLKLPRELRYYLEIVEKGDIPWNVYYLVLSIVGMSVSLIFRNLLACVISLCFLISSIFHVHQTYRLSG